MCHEFSGEFQHAAIISSKEVYIKNDSFYVESTFKYLGDMIGQCSGCSDTVSTCIVSSWKAFQEFVTIFNNPAIQTKCRGNVFHKSVRQVLLYGSNTWPVVTKDAQQLVTADSGMVRWICGVSLEDRIPTTDLLLHLCLSSINGMLHWNLLQFHGHLIYMMIMHCLKRQLPCIMLMADNQKVDQVRSSVV